LGERRERKWTVDKATRITKERDKNPKGKTNTSVIEELEPAGLLGYNGVTILSPPPRL
jgi:hypothetical protein